MPNFNANSVFLPTRSRILFDHRGILPLDAVLRCTAFRHYPAFDHPLFKFLRIHNLIDCLIIEIDYNKQIEHADAAQLTELWSHPNQGNLSLFCKFLVSRPQRASQKSDDSPLDAVTHKISDKATILPHTNNKRI